MKQILKYSGKFTDITLAEIIISPSAVIRNQSDRVAPSGS